MIEPIERPSRWRFTYAFEIVAIDGTGRGANRVWNFPVNPSSYSVRANPSAEIVWAAGGASVHESGFVPRDVSLSGSTGLEKKRGWALESDSPYSPTVGVTYRDGNELYDELNRIFEWYWKTKRSQDTAAKWMLVFHDFRRERHWVVVPKELGSSRDEKAHRLHYPYELQFTAVADYDALDLSGGVMGAFAFLRNVADRISNTISTVTGWIRDADAFVKTAEAAIMAPMRAVQAGVAELVDAVGDLERTVGGVLGLPQRAVRDTLDKVEELEGLLREAIGLGGTPDRRGSEWYPGNGTSSRNAAMYASTRQAEAAILALLATRDIWQPNLNHDRARRARLSQGEAGLSRAETAQAGSLALGARVMPGSGQRAAVRRLDRGKARPSYTGVREYVVQIDDTLRSIAVHELGDPSLWAEIAGLNGLRPPYISRAALPHTVMPGRSILLPTLDTPIEGAGGRPGADLEVNALGRNWKLTDSGDLEVNAARNGATLVEGMPCYVQGLERVRFACKVGDNPVYPGVGIMAPVGAKNGPGVVQAVALSVRRACLTDPRTQSVVDLVIDDGGDTVTVAVKVQPKAMSGPILVYKREAAA